MAARDLFVATVFQIGPLEVTNTVINTWAIMGSFAAVAWLIKVRLREPPPRWQVVVESIVQAMHDTVANVSPRQARALLPLIGTLWLFIGAANLASLIPGVRSPTGDLSLTAALAGLVFVSVHAFGLYTHGFRTYLRHYLTPNPLLLPFHVMGELSRTVALAVRLFGNVFSLQMAAAVVLLVAGFLAPVPVLLLHVVEALVQAYIFGMLALVYIGAAIQSQEASLQTADQPPAAARLTSGENSD